MTTRIPTAVPVTVLALVIGLGAWMWILEPGDGLSYAASMFMLPAAWLAIRAVQRARGRAHADDLAEIRMSLTGAGVIVALALGTALVTHYGLVAASFAERSSGITMGVVLMVVGNFLPKALTPMAESSCDPARAQSVQRFAGWTFVLAGLAYTIAWLVLPVEIAGAVATASCAGAVVLVLARAGWARLRVI